MKRWRPIAWLVVSVACFIAAIYFWRLGDKWQAQKPAQPAAPATASNAPAAQSDSSTNRHVQMKSTAVISASTAPVVALNPPASNSPVYLKTNAFPYRLSNTTRTVGQLSRDNHAILLENALIDSSSSADLNIPDSLKSHGDPGAYLVQSQGPMNDFLRGQIDAAGATRVSYFPNNAYLVTATPAAASMLSQNFVVRPWEPYFKVKAALMPLALSGQGVDAADIAVFPGMLEQTKAALEKMGITVGSESSYAFGSQLPLRNVSSIASVAALPGVEEIEPSFARIKANDLTRVIMSDSVDPVVSTNYLGLSGSNVLVAVADSFIPTNGGTVFNPDLTNFVVDPDFFPVGMADTEGHGTHVAGIIGGSGEHSPTNAVGSVPGANFRGKAPLSTLLALPALDPFVSDATLQETAARSNAPISNNSWGYGTSDYNLAAANYDQGVRDSLPGTTGSQPVLYVWAAGNNGNGDDGGLGGTPDSILSPAVSKNGIAVAASELPRMITNNVYVCDTCDTNSTGCTTNQPWQGMTDSQIDVARFSSRGNVGIGVEGDFGRFKPDVVAPGTFVVSTRSMTWDQASYYNPVTDDTLDFINETVATNNFTFYSTFVPCDALSLSIQVTPLHPNPINLPIYAKGTDFPNPPADLVGSNSVLGTIAGGPDFTLSPVDTFWFYAVGNPTNETVTYDIFSDVRRTNELGSYWDVLRTNLNDQLISSNYPTPLYRYESGTSMAAPAVSGTLALMEDFFTNRLHYTPSPALLKALLINGARSLDSKYNFQVQNKINFQGWGLVNLTNSVPPGMTNVYNAAAPMIILDQDPTNALATGDTRTLFVQVNTNAQPGALRVTLVWTDPPGNPAASIKLVNNLDLIVTNLDDPTNPVIFLGNNFGPSSLYTSPWNGDTNNIPPSDNINNVENVYIPGFLGTNYSITVAARSVNVNAVTSHTNGVVQDYALVISSANGDVTNALTLQNGAIAGNYQVTLTAMTNQFTQSPDTSGGLLTGQRVGASSPLQGTNELALTNQFNWGSNGLIRLGVTNQWHFYVITNSHTTNASTTFTNAAFATFLPSTLSIPPVGVRASDESFATRPEADIDLYVARSSLDPNAWGLTNLDTNVVASSFKSLSRGGTEVIVFSNAQPDEVFYIGVHSEDQEASEFDFLAVFSENPFSSMVDGTEYLHGINVPTLIPDGTPELPGKSQTLAIAVQPITIRRVVVTNIMEHENFGDLVGTLSHSRIPVVLNNHTFGNGTTNQSFIYEDNDEGDVPGAIHPDGPGRLQDFIGQEGLGLWLLEETDNALFNTGRVDNLFIKLDPAGTNGVIATILPDHFFYDFVDVPAAATNFTVCVNFIPPSVGPVQLYIRYGEQPTLGAYDYTKVINNPGDCLSISRSDLPPLRPGRYYIGIFNPTAQTQTVQLTWSFILDPNGANPTPITSPSPVIPLPDDAVTNNSIFITNQQNIVSVNVGVVLKHPRVSDLDLTLVAPTGQRILLFENRGGLSATNMGHLNIFTNFFGSTSSGDAQQNNNVIGPIPTFGTLIIDYNFFDIPDRLDVFDGPLNIFSSGLISESNTFTIPYNLINGNTLTIVMNQGNNPNGGTKWTYTPRVVSQDFTYLTFTDDTNLTDMPIKFAIPPYDGTDNGTNFALSGFESSTNGEYRGATNIPDAFGGWTMTTNDVFIRSNYFGGTNLLSMASNQVSVVTDPFNASSGSNYLALARGSISRTISLDPFKNYTISYFYRGPGIAGWWRGEGNAADSGDPEFLGNNGSLIGRFNFPAGEVGQAFALEDSGLAFQFAGTNTYVQVPQSQSLDVGTGSGFTVEGWINPTNITFQQPMVEWLAHVPTNSVINGQPVTNLTVLAGPFLNRETSHYYYLIGQTNWTTSELWANALGGHLAEVDDANEQNWIYDTFAQFAGSNYTMWIGLTNTTGGPTTNFVWSTGNPSVVYTNWALGEPTNCPTAHYAAILSATNGLPGLWTLLDNNGLKCTGAPTNKPFGVVEVNEIQTNGVQFWISVTNATNLGLGRLYANIFDTNGVPHEIFSPAGLIQSNVYQHVALTYNTNSGIANLYYAGTNVASTNLGVFVPKTGGDVLIGKDMSRATNNFFWGRMDEMSIYSRFLSPSEILAIYRVSAGTTNRNIGKFDPAITPAESLGEAQVSFGGITNLIFGNNNAWQVQGFSLKTISNTLPVQITGIEPGVLLDSFSIFQKPPGNLFYFPEQPLQALVGSNAFGNWTLEIRDARTGAVATNAELQSWQLQFILQTNTPVPIQLAPQTPATNNVPPGEIAYFTVFVPAWANTANNVLVSSTSPVDLLFNQTTPPDTGAPGDFLFVNNNTTGAQLISAVPPSTPPLLRGQTYYLGVHNNGTVPAQVVVRVDFDITTLTNGVPFTSTLNTNDIERPFLFNVSSNATEATFQLLKMNGNADLVLRKGLPLPTMLSADYGSFSGSNADETIYVLTNSLPVPLSQGPWYLDVIKRSLATDSGGSNTVTYSVLAKQLTNLPTVITLSNRVPMNFTAGPGAALTNFFKFSVTNFPLTGATNLGIHFELFNQTGNGDLTVQTNALPLAPPFLQSSRLPFDTSEIIFIRTNASSSTNLNADWYLGVPNNEIVPINYTIVAEIDTNAFAAFPTAEGAGADTRGGALSTNVYHVTSLADSGFGSFREGVNTLTNGGTIVFDRFGTINLTAPLFITNSFLTIAGQTAPGSGVTVAGAPTIVQNAHDLIIRYLRFRPDTNGASIDINGSFENPPTFPGNSYSAGQTFGGWTVLSGTVDDVSAAGGWQAADGNASLDMNGLNAGAISRTVPTVAGKRYNLRFAYAGNPDDPNGGTKTMQVSWGANLLGTVSFNIAGHSDTNMGWTYTNFTVVGTGSDLLKFASTTTTGLTQFGPTLDAVSLTSGVGDSLQVTNASNVIFDHISAEFGATNDISVLNSSNVTVQWSVMAESENQADSASGGSEIRHGSGDVTFHHNLYVDNYSGNPTIGEDVSLDFVNNVVFNWGIFAGFSTNDLANNPGGLTNFLNYSANYLIAGSNSVFTNMAFWSSSANTWIFQTNNFIDTNKNAILDGANTSWGMFANQYTPFSHAFDIAPATAPDEAFIAYERVLDFAGTSLEKRDPFDRDVVQRTRLQPAITNASSLLSGMTAWWPGEGNGNDITNGNTLVLQGVTFGPGEVGQAFQLLNTTNSFMHAPASPSLNVGAAGKGLTMEGWINVSSVSGFRPIAEWHGNSHDLVGVQLWLNSSPAQSGALFGVLVDTNFNQHPVVSPSGIVQPNVFQHVAMTYDQASGVATLYVNGAVVNQVNVGSFVPLTSYDLWFGHRPLDVPGDITFGSYLGGSLDEFSVYNRALTPCEIADIYNAGSAGKQSIISSSTNSVGVSQLPFLDVDRDGVPDFWEITLNENATNFDSFLDRDFDGYSNLEEYMNWLGVPHALTLHDTKTNVDLYTLSGNTGNLLFGVANGTNGSVYLTNFDACGIGNPHIAVFTPTNDFGNGTNGGFASFSYMVTNTDTMAHFGPVTVSVFVSTVPITNSGLSTNIIIFPNPPNQATYETVPYSYTNAGVDSDTNALLSYTITTVINTNATVANGWPLTNLTLIPSPTIDANGVITWTPTETQGPGVYTITTIVTDNGIPPAHATNTFDLTVLESNLPPVFVATPPNLTNTALIPIVVTNSATDSDIPFNPLGYTLLNPPAGMTIDTNGVITWTPGLLQTGIFTITTVVTDTNVYAPVNKNLSATNTFTIVINPAVAPFVFTQPAQAVTLTSAKLNGMATPNGLPTVAWFEWGTNTLYGNQTTPVNIGNSFNVVYTNANITGLLPNVPYHFRMVVSNIFGGPFHGFDQVLDQARVVAWGADYVRQIEVPPGLSNIVAVAGAYDHSMALKDNGTVVAWGDNTFNQTNVPPGLNSILAIAGGQYHSMALQNNGTVVTWGPNLLNVTNVPPGLNNVVMIASGTTASLALRNNGSIVSWGANLFNVTNPPPGLNNVVEVAGGSYHSLAIRNNGTVVAWGDNSAGQTNVPASATNVVAIAGGNYHSLALRFDGTVVSWGDNSAGQTNVPAGLSNVVAIAAGGFHSLALKNDGTVVGWGDNTAGQAGIPTGLTNVVAISAGYFHNLALTPSLVLTNPIVLPTTNGLPQTNSILGDTTVFYRVDVPPNADAATNELIFTVNGPLNIWYSTNTPPTVATPVDFHLLTNTVNGTSLVATATSPQLIPGSTYYLGVQNTNTFAISYAIQVDFHLTATGPSTNTIPISGITKTNINGTNGFLLVWFAPTNDLFQVQWAPGLPPIWNTFTNIIGFHTFIDPTNSEFEFFDDGSQTGGLTPGRYYQLILLNGGVPPPATPPLTNGVPSTNTVAPGTVTFYQVNVPANVDSLTNALLMASLPLNLWFTTNVPPTITNPADYLLLPGSTNGAVTSVPGSGLPPTFVPGATYYLGVQNTNGTAVTYAVQVGFHFQANQPLTNTVPISTVVHTNINGTNGFLLVWFAPTNELFQVQWANGLPPVWATFTNIVGYHTFISPTNSEFEFFDDGSQTGGFVAGRFYQLILLGGAVTPPSIPILTNAVPATGNIAPGTVSFYQVNVPANVDFVTNSLLPSSAPLNLWFTTNVPPTVAGATDYLLVTNATSGSLTSIVGSGAPPTFVPGATYYLGVQNTNATPVTYGVRVDFHFLANQPQTNTVPISTVTHTNINGTNGFLLVWFAPTNEQFQVQWAPGLPPVWSTFTNIISYHTLISPTNSEFEFFDDGSQTGGFVAGRFYQLILLNSGVVTPPPPSTNVPPISSIAKTNVGGTNHFLLTWFAPTNELFQVQWSAGLGSAWTSFTNIISYSQFISPTNSEFTFLDDGSQSGGLGGARFYRIILYNGAAPNNPTIVPLANGVPLNFTTGAGLTNFFSFDITQTNSAVLFELYNLTGNGDLIAQQNSLPASPPAYASANAGTNFEQIVIRTNGSIPNLNAISWFLGVPNQSASPISYTIRAVVPTNGMLVSGQPLNTTYGRPGGTNVQIIWGPTIPGEKYEIRTNNSLGSPNWIARTDIIAIGTSGSFTEPTLPPVGPPLFYEVVQVP